MTSSFFAKSHLLSPKELKHNVYTWLNVCLEKRFSCMKVKKMLNFCWLVETDRQTDRQRRHQTIIWEGGYRISLCVFFCFCFLSSVFSNGKSSNGVYHMRICLRGFVRKVWVRVANVRALWRYDPRVENHCVTYSDDEIVWTCWHQICVRLTGSASCIQITLSLKRSRKVWLQARSVPVAVVWPCPKKEAGKTDKPVA